MPIFSVRTNLKKINKKSGHFVCLNAPLWVENYKSRYDYCYFENPSTIPKYEVI